MGFRKWKRWSSLSSGQQPRVNDWETEVERQLCPLSQPKADQLIDHFLPAAPATELPSFFSKTTATPSTRMSTFLLKFCLIVSITWFKIFHGLTLHPKSSPTFVKLKFPVLKASSSRPPPHKPHGFQCIKIKILVSFILSLSPQLSAPRVIKCPKYEHKK